MRSLSDQEKPQVRPATVVGVCFLLATAVFLVFGQTFRYEFVNYDDDEYMYENPQVAKGLTPTGIHWAFTQAHSANWHPLTYVSHMLDCQFYGLKPGGHHLTNVMLHAATAILLFLVLRQMTGALWPSAFAAAVFAIHPLRVESVAWVAERKDVLSGLFFMLTLMMYERYARKKSGVEGQGASENTAVQSPGSRVWTFDYGLTLLFFALGLMSKPMLVTLPFVLLLLDYWPLQRFAVQKARQSFWPLVREKLPLFLLVAVSSVVTMCVQKSAAMSLKMAPITSRMSNAVASYAIYVLNMFWPGNLAVIYPHRAEIPDWQLAGSLVLLLAVSGLAVMFWRRFPYLLTGWLWYLGMLIPVIGIVQVGYQSHADRYTYLPQIGLYLMAAFAARDLTVSWRYRRQVLWVASIMVIGTLMACASVQTSYWRNSESLWRHTLARTSDNAMAENNLGSWLSKQHRTIEAIEHCQKALAIAPNYAEAHYNLGALLAEENRPVAIEHFQQAIELKSDYAEAHYNLGVALYFDGRLTEAMEHCEKAVQLKPDYADAYGQLANVLAAQGRYARAAEDFQRALQINPNQNEIHNNFGSLLISQGNITNAIEQYQKALQIKPDYAEAHYNLAVAFALQNRLDDAVTHYRKAIQLKPDYAEAHENLANVLAAQGRLDEAIEHYNRVIELMPAAIQAHFRLGLALQKQNKFDEAIAQYRQVLRLNPEHEGAKQQLRQLESRPPN